MRRGGVLSGFRCSASSAPTGKMLVLPEVQGKKCNLNHFTSDSVTICTPITIKQLVFYRKYFIDKLMCSWKISVKTSFAKITFLISCGGFYLKANEQWTRSLLIFNNNSKNNGNHSLTFITFSWAVRFNFLPCWLILNFKNLLTR